MKTNIKLIVAAVAALLPLASSAFAGEPVGETPDYVITSIRVGNNQTPTVVYTRKPAAVESTVSIVRSKPVAAKTKVSTVAKAIVRQDTHGLVQTQFLIPGSIN